MPSESQQPLCGRAHRGRPRALARTPGQHGYPKGQAVFLRRCPDPGPEAKSDHPQGELLVGKQVWGGRRSMGRGVPPSFNSNVTIQGGSSDGESQW